jgi:hypothetical protein
MPLSQAKIDAYAAMESAIEKLRDAFDADPETPQGKTGEVITAWILVTNGVKFWDAGDPDRPDDDEVMQPVTATYAKRGQAPIVSHGLALAFLTDS